MSGTIEKTGLTGYEAQAAAVEESRLQDGIADATEEGVAPVEGEAPVPEAPKKKKPPVYTNDDVKFAGKYVLDWTSTSGFTLAHKTNAEFSPSKDSNAPSLYFEESGKGSLSDPSTFSGKFQAGPRFGNWNFLAGYVQAAEVKPEDYTDLNGDGAIDDKDKPQKDEPFIGTIEYLVLNNNDDLDFQNLKAGVSFTGVELRNMTVYAEGWQPISRNFFLPYNFSWNPSRTDSNASLLGEPFMGSENVKVSHAVEAGAGLLMHFEDSELVSKYAVQIGVAYTHAETVTNTANTSDDPYADYEPYSNSVKLSVNQYLPFGNPLSRLQIVGGETPLTIGASYEYGQSMDLGPWQGSDTEEHSAPTRNLSETTSYREEATATTSKLAFNVTWNALGLDVNFFPKQLDMTGSKILIGATANAALDLTGEVPPFQEKYVGITATLKPKFSKKKPESK